MQELAPRSLVSARRSSPRRAAPAILVIAASLALAPLALGCECEENPRPTRQDGGARADGALFTYPDAYFDLGSIDAISIDPPTAEVFVRDGVAEPASFTLVGTRTDGSSAVVPAAAARWIVDHPEIGSFLEGGVFTPSGARAGLVVVTATLEGGSGALSATATVTVRIEQTVPVGVAPSDASEIASMAPGAEAAPTITYPLDRVMMPQNVYPPDVQWQVEGEEGDVYRVRLSKPHVTLTALVAPDFGVGTMDERFQEHHFLPTPEQWRSLVDSDLEDPITLELTRFRAADRSLSAAHTIRMDISPGAIAGALYYWEVQTGRTMRIAPGEGTSAQITEPGTCVACHTVSRDGRYLSGSRDDQLYATVIDLTTTPASTTYTSYDPSWPYGAARPDQLLYSFSTFNPDASRLLINRLIGEGESYTDRYWTDLLRFALVDPLTGAVLPSRGLPDVPVSQPEWSPDGASIAFIGSVVSSNNAAHVFQNGDLELLPVTGPDEFGVPRMLLRGSDLAGQPEGGSANSHPTWSPDSQLIAFAHTEVGRATDGLAAICDYYPGALYVIPAAGGAPVRLDNANGPTSVGGGLYESLFAPGTHSYWPTFSPFTTRSPGGTGRVVWLAFFTTRVYGHRRTYWGACHETVDSQLWVTAIDLDAPPGTDPSHVPYWMPGQSASHHNVDGHWVASACRDNGVDCTSDSECCSGICNMTGEFPTCGPPPPSECRHVGAACGGTEDCCGALVCTGHACVEDVL